MSRLSCLLLVSQALVAFSAPTFQLAPKGLSVLPLGDASPQVLTLRENVARRQNAVNPVLARNKSEAKAAPAAEGGQAKAGKKAVKKVAKAAKKAAGGAAAAPAVAAPAGGAAAGGAAAAEGEKGAEVNLAGVFGTATALKGGNEKQDVLFTKAATGALEVEFQDVDVNDLTVTENKTPAAPPAGFKAIDTSSYKIALSKGADGLTLQKVDYVFDVANPAVAALDLTKSKIGKLCTEANAFVISDALGESEFEVEENEISLTVKNMIGEWGVFIPDTAVAAVAGGAAANATAPAAGGEKAGEKAAGEKAAGEKAAGEKAGEEEAGKPVVFGTAFDIGGGNVKQDFLFAPSAAGALELEFNGTSANRLVAEAVTPTGTLPDGFIFVDPKSFKIASEKPGVKGDIVKIDYIFTAAVSAAADVTQGKIAKLVNGAFVVQGLAADGGEFEFEAEENEWTLTTGNSDFNGEFAAVIPSAAVKQAAARL